MKVCELIEHLKRSDQLADVKIIFVNLHNEEWWYDIHSFYKNNGAFIVTDQLNKTLKVK